MTSLPSGATPGPWKPGPNGLIWGVGRNTIAQATSGNTVEGRANKTLIAAAPDLYAAVVDLMRNFPTDADMAEAGWESAEIESACAAHDRARAALAKADGGQA